jgi:hypothetical protein
MLLVVIMMAAFMPVVVIAADIHDAAETAKILAAVGPELTPGGRRIVTADYNLAHDEVAARGTAQASMRTRLVADTEFTANTTATVEYLGGVRGLEAVIRADTGYTADTGALNIPAVLRMAFAEGNQDDLQAAITNAAQGLATKPSINIPVGTAAGDTVHTMVARANANMRSWIDGKMAQEWLAVGVSAEASWHQATETFRLTVTTSDPFYSVNPAHRTFTVDIDIFVYQPDVSAGENRTILNTLNNSNVIPAQIPIPYRIYNGTDDRNRAVAASVQTFIDASPMFGNLGITAHASESDPNGGTRVVVRRGSTGAGTLAEVPLTNRSWTFGAQMIANAARKLIFDAFEAGDLGGSANEFEIPYGVYRDAASIRAAIQAVARGPLDDSDLSFAGVSIDVAFDPNPNIAPSTITYAGTNVELTVRHGTVLALDPESIVDPNDVELALIEGPVKMEDPTPTILRNTARDVILDSFPLAITYSAYLALDPDGFGPANTGVIPRLWNELIPGTTGFAFDPFVNAAAGGTGDRALTVTASRVNYQWNFVVDVPGVGNVGGVVDFDPDKSEVIADAAAKLATLGPMFEIPFKFYSSEDEIIPLLEKLVSEWLVAEGFENSTAVDVSVVYDDSEVLGRAWSRQQFVAEISKEGAYELNNAGQTVAVVRKANIDYRLGNARTARELMETAYSVLLPTIYIPYTENGMNAFNAGDVIDYRDAKDRVLYANSAAWVQLLYEWEWLGNHPFTRLSRELHAPTEMLVGPALSYGYTLSITRNAMNATDTRATDERQVNVEICPKNIV